MYAFIALLICFGFACWGWRRGVFALLLSLLGFALAYALVCQGTPAFANWLEWQRQWPALLAWPVAGLVLLVGASFVFNGCARGLRRRVPAQWRDGGKSAGAVLGVVLGAGLSVLVVWVAGALRDSWFLRQGEMQEPAEQVVGSPLQQLDGSLQAASGVALARLVGVVLGDAPVASVAAQWVREPLSIGEDLQYLSRRPALQQLFQQPENYIVLLNGTTAAVQQLADFRAVVADERAMRFLLAAGLPGETPSAQQEALAEMLSRFARNFERLRNLPEYRELANDPALRERLEQGDLLHLLTDDKMRRLVTLLVQGSPTPESALPGEKAASGQKATSGEKEKPKTLYRWKDADGRVHVTDQSPPEGIAADVIQP